MRLQVYTRAPVPPEMRSGRRAETRRPASRQPCDRTSGSMIQRPQAPSFPARRVLSRLRSGSSSPVLVETPAGRFVAKLRGAAQGPSALIAEVVVAELAERLGLP